MNKHLSRLPLLRYKKCRKHLKIKQKLNSKIRLKLAINKKGISHFQKIRQNKKILLN